ncbi:MAG: TraR/DksA family transcriptional regulator [Proteobacteria bacterium]|nr:TraR/DksA family transcriptional regulator [Pseudomonadota bacterium]
MFDMKTRSGVTWEKGHYMSKRQLDYFYNKLIALKAELENTVRKSLLKMKASDTHPIEEFERSALAIDRDIEIQTQAINWSLIQRIDQALERINDGSYGYCLETEEPIGIERLEANPLSIFCLTVQEQYEISEKQRITRI